MAKSKKELPMPKLRSSEHHFLLAFLGAILIPLVRLLFHVRPKGTEKLPKSGAYILVANHVTNVDALAMAYLVYVHIKRAPHFLAKEGLFRTPIVGWFLRNAGQIPVYRSGMRNDTPLRAAHEFLKAGHTIAIFPEGTLTRDPNLWPMRGRSGAIRLAIESNVPVFPVGQWGSEQVMPTYGSKFRPGFWKPVDMVIGDEIDLDKFRQGHLTQAQLGEATELVMRRITNLVAELRGESAPDKLWDPVEAGQTTTGNFKKAGNK